MPENAFNLCKSTLCHTALTINNSEDWLVVLRFDITLTAKVMAVGGTHVFPGFLTPALTQISFQSHKLLSSHASAEMRGETDPERKFRRKWVLNSQPLGHESNMLTTEPSACGNNSEEETF